MARSFYGDVDCKKKDSRAHGSLFTMIMQYKGTFNDDDNENANMMRGLLPAYHRARCYTERTFYRRQDILPLSYPGMINVNFIIVIILIIIFIIVKIIITIYVYVLSLYPRQPSA